MTISEKLHEQFVACFREENLRNILVRKIEDKKGEQISLDDIIYICRVVGFQMFKEGVNAGREKKVPPEIQPKFERVKNVIVTE